MTNGTDLDMSSDTNTQEKEIFNTAIMTYATEDQTGHNSAVTSNELSPLNTIR